MKAVEKNQEWELKNPRNGETWKKIKARQLFDLIAEHAWRTGDPGLAFLDRMEQDNPTPGLGRVEATNPCGEIPLLPYESCNLTSIVLSNHIKRATNSKQNTYEINWDDLEKSVKLGIRLLDNMIEVNAYPVTEIEEMVKNGNRRIGLGVMGFAHLLFLLGVPYHSEKAIKLAEKLAKFISEKAIETSLILAKQRGVFPNWDRSIYAGTKKRLRNCALTMIAPTGTISMLADCSSGIEPVFSLVTLRKTFFEDDRSNRPTKELTMVDPVFEQYLENKLKAHPPAGGSNLKTTTQISKLKENILGVIVQDNSLKNIDILTPKEKQIFVATHEIAPEWHVKIQAAWQKYFDNSVSKTINFPHTAKVDEVKRAYLLAWKLGCKGITIYRDGSKQDQVLNLSSKDSNNLQFSNSLPADATHQALQAGNFQTNTNVQNSNAENCPECGSELELKEGCATCANCGWSKCTL